MDDKRIFFMSGLQRSGSTILCNILQQHPDVFTVPTDPFYDVINNILTDVCENKTGSAFDFDVFDKGLQQFILQGLQGWYKSLTEKPVILSKNRNWHRLSHLFPEVKYIATVRDIFDVANSIMKKQYGNHSISQPLHAHYIASSNIEHFLSDHVLQDEGLQVGLKNLLYLNERHPHRVEFIRYEDLLTDSVRVLRGIERHLDVEPFEYDLANIQQQSLYEHEGFYVGQCSHITHQKLQDPNTAPVIPAHALEFLQTNDRSSWFYDIFYPVD